MRGRHPPRHLGVLLILAVLGALAFSGCTSDSAVPENGPLTLREAHRLAAPVLKERAPFGHLVGFVGHEGPPPRFLEGVLAEFVPDVDTSFDEARGDGRAYVWVLLYGTPEGQLLRVLVRDAPRSVTADWSDTADPQLVKQLWAMNLEGRLVVDSPAAVRALGVADERIAAHLTEHPGGDVVYASSIALIDGPGSEDLVYEVYFAAPEMAGDDYAYYGQVHHFTGSVVRTADASEARATRQVTLVERTFTLGPVPNEVYVTEDLPRRVENTRLKVTAEGSGLYTLEILQDNETRVGGVEGRVVAETAQHDELVGTLEPGEYTLHVEVTGRVTFDLSIDGMIGL